jgi:hypothetical protein
LSGRTNERIALNPNTTPNNQQHGPQQIHHPLPAGHPTGADHRHRAEGQQMLENGHLLKGILEVDPDVSPFLLKKLNVNTDAMQQALDRIVNGYPKVQRRQTWC